jgi:hypothetical protein
VGGGAVVISVMNPRVLAPWSWSCKTLVRDPAGYTSLRNAGTFGSINTNTELKKLNMGI